jgi:hypothetical protein
MFHGESYDLDEVHDTVTQVMEHLSA